MTSPINKALNPFNFGSNNNSSAFQFSKDSGTEDRLSNLFNNKDVQVGLAAASQKAHRPFGVSSIG